MENRQKNRNRRKDSYNFVQSACFRQIFQQFLRRKPTGLKSERGKRQIRQNEQSPSRENKGRPNSLLRKTPADFSFM